MMNLTAELRAEVPEAALERLETQVRHRLVGRVRDLRLRACDGGLVLDGRAPTYYAKQLAQHAVMQATDLPIRANDIQVA
jgi:hypothetical protein